MTTTAARRRARRIAARIEREAMPPARMGVTQAAEIAVELKRQPHHRPHTDATFLFERMPLSPRQLAAARRIRELWETVSLAGRSVTMQLDSRGGGEMSDRRAAAHAWLQRMLREMGQWRSAEVVGLVCYDERRDLMLVKEGLEMASEVERRV